MSPGTQTILVVEDEPSIAETIVYALRTEGFDPQWKTTGIDALSVLQTQPVALVVLDLGLPDMSGFDVCREIRRLGSTPVIFLTARAGEIDRVVGLELGADDYVAKPFSPRELTARVRAILRRTANHGSVPSADDHVGSAGPGTCPGIGGSPGDRLMPVWHHDTARCRISYRGAPLELTRNEYRLLAALIAAPGRVFSREQLMAVAWDDPGAAMDRTVDAHIKSLRAKIRDAAPDADPIVTHRGLGYSAREEA
jgi:two-component system catabolic regulation response regulator CreB